MLLMLGKEIRHGICYSIHQYVKVNNKYIKDCDKNKGSCFKYWTVNNSCGWGMMQKLPAGSLKWVENTCHFIKDFSWGWCSVSWKIKWTSQ